jgi:hypothetical protein
VVALGRLSGFVLRPGRPLPCYLASSFAPSVEPTALEPVAQSEDSADQDADQACNYYNQSHTGNESHA